MMSSATPTIASAATRPRRGARTADTGRPRLPAALQRLRHDLLRLLDDPLEVLLAAEGLRVDLVDVLGPGGARREPAALGDDLQPADLGVVAGRAGEHVADRLARELVGV